MQGLLCAQIRLVIYAEKTISYSPWLLLTTVTNITPQNASNHRLADIQVHIKHNPKNQYKEL
jgi:hypothetical protein